MILDAAAGRSPTAVPRVLPPPAARLLRVEGRDDIGGEEPVAPGDSVVAVERDETRWTFTPREPWKPGDYRVAVDTALEDLAGGVGPLGRRRPPAGTPGR